MDGIFIGNYDLPHRDSSTDIHKPFVGEQYANIEFFPPTPLAVGESPRSPHRRIGLDGNGRQVVLIAQSEHSRHQQRGITASLATA